MKSIRVSLVLLSLLFSLCASAKDVTDTLCSSRYDRIIVSYSILKDGNKVDLKFNSVKKILGDYYHDKYRKDVDKVQVLFFDWIGVRDGVKFSGETPSTIAFPAKADYKKSYNGFFIADQNPSISFTLESDGATSFSVPLYLAHYEGKQHYKVLCLCGNLEIQLPSVATQPKNPGTGNKPQPQQNSGASTGAEEENSELDEQAISLINSIMSSLALQDTLPMESTLERKVENLVDLQSKIKNNDISRKIDETLFAYNEKKKELMKQINEKSKQMADDNAFAGCTTKEDFERYAKQHPDGKHVEEAQGKIKEFEDQAKEEERNKKKRNIWMIIGGILMAILLFLGNQVIQTFRNRRTQRNIMQMQKDATNRAKSMARSKTQGAINKQTNKIIKKARTEGQNIIRGAGKNAKDSNGNNRVSI